MTANCPGHWAVPRPYHLVNINDASIASCTCRAWRTDRHCQFIMLHYHSQTSKECFSKLNLTTARTSLWWMLPSVLRARSSVVSLTRPRSSNINTSQLSTCLNWCRTPCLNAAWINTCQCFNWVLQPTGSISSNNSSRHVLTVQLDQCHTCEIWYFHAPSCEKIALRDCAVAHCSKSHKQTRPLHHFWAFTTLLHKLSVQVVKPLPRFLFLSF